MKDKMGSQTLIYLISNLMHLATILYVFEKGTGINARVVVAPPLSLRPLYITKLLCFEVHVCKILRLGNGFRRCAISVIAITLTHAAQHTSWLRLLYV